MIEHLVLGKVEYKNFTNCEKIIFCFILFTFVILIWLLIVLKVQSQLKSYYKKIDNNLELASLTFIDNRVVRREVSPKAFIDLVKQIPLKDGSNVYTLTPKLKLKFECIIKRKKIYFLVYQYNNQVDTYTVALEYANTFYVDTFFNLVKTLDITTINQNQFEQFQNL